jgi:ABC-2 type transport system ATP-binding protein/lipopolysaccharide transport system ATP-binding protein
MMGNKKNIYVSVSGVSLMYNLSRHREERIKEYFLNMIRGKLFFDPFWALNDISFKLFRGDSLGIVGHNGAGKSSLLKIVSGIIKPTKGDVATRGVIAPIVELGGGFDGSMTAKENIFFLGAMHGFPKKYMQGKYDEIIDFAELRDFADVPVSKFSSGMSGKLSFALATLITPDILVADEALAVGDMAFRHKCEKRLQDIVDRGAIILFVSHSVEQVKKICQKTLWLDHGNAMMYGDSAEVCEAYKKFMQEKEKEQETRLDST